MRPSLRVVLGAALAGSLVLPILGGPTAERAEAANVGVVKVAGGAFVLNGAPFRFVGTNAYYLLDAANYGSLAHTTQVLALANQLGFTVVRTWAFMDGTGSTGGFQTSPGVYNETTARQLDWILDQADQAGVRLILTLTDYWSSYGGMPQYVTWCDRPNAPVDVFYTNSSCRQMYKNWVAFLANRVNTYNGRVYKQDPTIFAWELANEPRSGDPTGLIVRDWVAEMAAYLKVDLQVSQMVDTGEEGFDTTSAGYGPLSVYNNQSYLFTGGEGVSFTENTKDPNIDFATAHLYPEYWQFGFEAGKQWIADHLAIARALGKPFLLGEFGVSSGAVPDEADRAAIMKGWLDTWEGLGGGGALVFEMICGACTNYGGSMATIYPPATAISDTLAAAAALANAGGGGGPGPTPPQVTQLTPSSIIAGSPAFTLTVSGTGFDAGAVILWTVGNVTTARNTVAAGNGLTTNVSAGEVANPATVLVAVRNASGAVSNSVQFAVVPPSPASCPSGQFKAEYFSNTNLSGTPAVTVCETQISHDWGVGGPGYGLPSDNFSVRWTGSFTFTNRRYTFSATADDGVRVWLDGAILIDAWKDQPPTKYTARRRVSAGQHEVKVEYYERAGGAVISVAW